MLDDLIIRYPSYCNYYNHISRPRVDRLPARLLRLADRPQAAEVRLLLHTTTTTNNNNNANNNDDANNIIPFIPLYENYSLLARMPPK